MKKQNGFRSNYGPWAVVAGASEGIGAAFAAQLAARGLDLVLVARRTEQLTELGRKLTSEYGTRTRCLSVDLASNEGPTEIAAQTGDLEVGLLVFNAAFSVVGPFFGQSLEEHYREIDLNCRAPMAMAYSFGKRMLARGRGGILLMSSLSAFQGTPLVSNYAATKAYNLLLAEGLWDELRMEGIDVLACCAGATQTPAFLATRPKNPPFISVPIMSPDAVAREALANLGRNPSMITGRQNRLSSFLMRRALPRRIAIRLMGQTMRAMYAAPEGDRR
jgi:short-subunit dehydrogenase